MDKPVLPSDKQKPACPGCHAVENQVMAGKNASGSQRYRCKLCGRRYTPQPVDLGYPRTMREQAVRLYLGGMSFRSIARLVNVNHQTVVNWLNEHAAQTAARRTARLPQDRQ